ncbi:glutamate-5-semialdehyde dehydrogenase, partial [Listeria monocytogenes]|nr:glutamate-5-semialdehyde dehydrogenase [Listeria monocytogenes]
MTELIKKGSGAKEASQFLAQATTKHKNAALLNLSNDLLIHTATLLQENEKDILRAKQKGTPETMIDRLRLTEERIKEISEAVKQVVALKDPIGEVTNMWKNEAELTIGKTRVPLGVIGIIYESRPNVTVDASVLCFKTGNAVILRGGSDAIDSNKALMSVIQDSLEASGFPRSSVQLIEDTSRETARDMMRLNRFLDVLIPRGGARLIQTVLENATVPVIETGTGNCHIYVDKAAEKQMAIDILVNAKCSRPSVCNAAETLLIHRDVAEDYLPAMETALKEYDVELRADERAKEILQEAKAAKESDWEDEFLDFILAVKVVDSAE